jgi:hypothetical protein
MEPSLGRPKYPVLYLIFPIIMGFAFAVPATDAALQAIDVEPTSGARFLAIAVAGLLIFVVVLGVFIGIRRIGKN